MRSAYLYGNRKRRSLFRVKVILFIVLFIFLATVIFFLRNASRVLISVCEVAAKSYTAVAVTHAAEQAFAQIPDYSSLITVLRDEDGNVNNLIANAPVINSLARNTAYLTRSALNELASQGVDIPIGAFTGIDALTGFGFKINFKVIPVSAVECCFISRFTSAGINQTLHSLYIQIVSNISIVTPSQTVNVGATDEILVCESIIVGEIPQYILGGGWLNSNGALVPQSG